MHPDVQLRQLEYVTALARERHFGRAARACFVSQPALSMGVHRLEAELGVRIVERGQRFRGFTPEGEIVVAWARRVLAERDGLHDDLQQLRGGLTATLRLGVIPSAEPATPLITQRFIRAHPNARVRIEALSAPDITRRLTEFEIDVGMTYLSAELEATTRARPLYAERYLLLVPDDHPLADAGAVSWSDAATLPLCVMTPAMRNRQILDTAAALAGARLTPAVEVASAGAMYAHVVSGRAPAIVSHAWLWSLGVPPGMRARRLPVNLDPPAIGLIAAARTPTSVLADALWDALEGVDVEAALSPEAVGGDPRPLAE